MAYALIVNEQVAEYPIYSLFDKYPNISFSLPIDNTQFPVGIVEVQETVKPTINYTQDLREDTPVKVGEFWQQAWTVLQTPQEEVTKRVEILKNILQKAVQNRLDSFAQTRRYDSMLSCCTYYNSTYQKFQTEAQYCVQARDSTWEACYAILAQFEAGQRPLPTVEQLLSELPTLQWPN
jgi:hypothetical protein